MDTNGYPFQEDTVWAFVICSNTLKKPVSAIDQLFEWFA